MTKKDKCSIKLNKLNLTEASILELRKVLLYDFHHRYIKNKYDGKDEQLFTVLIVSCMKLKLKMFMKVFARAMNYLTSVNVQKIQNIVITQIL